MALPGNNPGLWQHSVHDTPVEKDDHYRNRDSTPATHKESGGDKITDKSINNRARTNVNPATPDQPGAQAARDPNGTDRLHGLIPLVEKNQDKKKEQAGRVGRQMSSAPVQKWTEQDSDQTWTRAGHNSKSIQLQAQEKIGGTNCK